MNSGFITLEIIAIMCITLTSVSLMAYGSWIVLKEPFRKFEEQYIETASGKLDQMFVFLAPELVLYFKMVGALVFFFLFYLLFSGIKFFIVTVVVSIVAAICGFMLPEWILNYLQKKRLALFEVQLVEALQMLANSLKAGLSFPQCLEMLSKEGRPPLSQELILALKENKLGISLDKALENMSRRVPSEDLGLVVDSVLLTRELGGNLATIFERLAYTIRERMKLKGKVDALTSQGKMQGLVVGLMPVLLGGVLFLINPGMMHDFFNSIVGWVLVGFSIFWELLGLKFIKSIVSIDI